jgi:hypothetical protein
VDWLSTRDRAALALLMAAPAAGYLDQLHEDRRPGRSRPWTVAWWRSSARFQRSSTSPGSTPEAAERSAVVDTDTLIPDASHHSAARILGIADDLAGATSPSW